MIADQVISKCIDEIGDISGAGLMVADAAGQQIASTADFEGPEMAEIRSFIDCGDENRQIAGRMFIRIKDDDETAFVIISGTSGNDQMSARFAAAEIGNLITAYKEKVDRNSFFQALLLENLLPVDIYNRAQRLHIEVSQRRCVFIIEPVGVRKNNLIDMVRELFYTESGDHITAVDEDRVVVIKALSGEEGEAELEETALMLVDMAGSEALSDVRVAYGTVAEDIKGVSGSYKEAKMALEVGKIFYPLKRTIEYSNLGVGRLIYQLPVNLCRLFVREIFGDDIPEEIDEEVLTTVNKFFENSLNVSETSRQLFIHRNTLIYRIEKLQKATGLDVRVFDDALTLKIALMVVNYMKYVS